ncbi:MAG: UDP-N-acetylglucosamine 2-epimerase (non-hydrolyzing) [Ignavibacteriales bacterium]|nr:UDP-N-acetylglucosamine 2-epimerase (non-hydrolyzing) [Ignavibacteriales bacterium]
MKKLAVIFGTRPDTIKLAPLILELQKHPQFFTLVTIATAQHRTMLDDVLSVFGIAPDYDLNVMSEKQSLSVLTQSLMAKLDEVLGKEKPDMVIVQGDTATTFTASLCAFYHRIPVVHIEAGLRTKDKYYPFPEEIFRRLTTHTSDIHCTPTAKASKDLMKEGIKKEAIYCTGNTVIDALQIVLRKKKIADDPVLERILLEEKKIVVVTTHRRENWGEPMKNVCEALHHLASGFPDINFVFPVHLNPVVREVVQPVLSGIGNVHLIDPLKYSDFAHLLSRSYFVISDSGGLQEEAPSLGVPVLVVRTITERPEAVRYGAVKLVGTDRKKIVVYAEKLLTGKKFYRTMSRAVNPYGDGKASERIVSALLYYFGFSKKRMKEFTPRAVQQ